MARYKMTINTDTYKCGRCSKKNWEAGTRNDYMIAINGITRTLYNMREVMWQLELFHGNSFLSSMNSVRHIPDSIVKKSTDSISNLHCTSLLFRV